MDVLKDITEGLRKGGKSERDESARDEGERDGGARDESPQEETEQKRSNSEKSHKSPDSRESTGDPDEDDAHVCSFCEAEFDAERETCPECDARIILRGAR